MTLCLYNVFILLIVLNDLITLIISRLFVGGDENWLKDDAPKGIWIYYHHTVEQNLELLILNKIRL